MSKKQKWYLLTTLILFSVGVVFFQYQADKNKHYRLEKFGEVVKIISKKHSSFGVDYATYHFITKKGQLIERNEKCGNEYGYKEYINASVIYNPTNPKEFELSFDFKNYSLLGRIFFFFFVYLPAMIFIAYNFVRTIFTIFNR